MNQVDSREIASLLEAMGFQRSGDMKNPTVDEQPDLVIVNSCTVTARADTKSLKAVRSSRTSWPGAFLVLTGCLAANPGFEPAVEPGVETGSVGTESQGWDLILQPGCNMLLQLEEALKNRFFQPMGDELLSAGPGSCFASASGPDTVSDSVIDAETSSDTRTRGFVVVQKGCQCFCTYCIVPYVRGPVSSRSEQVILKEIASMCRRGVREIVLTGINIGRYGEDEDESSVYFRTGLQGLVSKILQSFPEISRLRVSSLEPMDLKDEFLEIMASDPRFCPHLHLPFQSGSDRILKKMGRPYTRGDLERVLDNAFQRFPHLNITCDMIAGFPGETEEDFNLSVELVEKCGITKVHAFPFSPRPGTPAHDLSPRVPNHVSKQRVRLLEAAGRRNFIARAGGFMGCQLEVLVEGSGKDGLWRGLAPDYMRVAFSVVPGNSLPLTNRLVQVTIDGTGESEMHGVLSSGQRGSLNG